MKDPEYETRLPTKQELTKAYSEWFESKREDWTLFTVTVVFKPVDQNNRKERWEDEYTKRVLGKIRKAIDQYPLIRANITDERTSIEAQVEQLQDEIDGIARHKKWVDWVGTFQKQIADHKKFTPQQKRSFLEGILAGVDVRLLETKTHQLTINFQLPIVNDSIEYKTKGKKSGPYVVQEGTRSVTLEPLSGAGIKKKDV